MNYWLKLINRFITAFLVLALSPVWANALTVDRVVAKVNEEIITMSALLERYNAEMVRYNRMGVSEIPPKEQVMQDVLNRMIDERLQIQDGKKLGMTVEEEMILKALDDIKQANQIGDAEFEQMLKQEMTTMDQYKETIRNQILVSKVVGFQVKNRTKVSETEVKKQYAKNKKKYWTPPVVKARHILFIMDQNLTQEDLQTKENKAEMVLELLKKGGDFEDLARKYSEDVSAASGGDLGELSRGKMVKEFEDAVFSLKKGQISGLVRTPYGIHIIKVDDIKEGALRPFEEVRPEIEQELAAKKFDQVYQSYMRDLRDSAFIEKSLFDQAPKTSRSTHARRTPSNREVSKKPLRSMRSSRTSSQGNRGRKKIDPDDLFAPLTIPVSTPDDEPVVADVKKHPRTSSAPKGRFEKVQEALIRIKKMRDENQISEAEYRRRKSKLLEQL